jgi:hypothetical protein
MECRGHGAPGGDWVRLCGFYPNPAAIKRHHMNDGANTKTWMCLICGFNYDEASGIPEEGIPPGTR